ncbi:uncharacterized protein LOC118751610 [Rhagoletis pomonella]|uniref:uncharacterized protein LOC118751610 n=1 Tax=Rhagoletis pomonella TaxID=28610 RepID=UPI001786FBBB|nr:uncharacterized protein LOC118751610 [Rhagoletis pomonella]
MKVESKRELAYRSVCEKKHASYFLRSTRAVSRMRRHASEIFQHVKTAAEAVDFLQGDKEVVYGYLLPTLATISTKYNNLIRAGKLVYFWQIISPLLEAVKERFKNFYELKEEVTLSALCPDVKLQWVYALDPINGDAKVAELSEKVRKIISRSAQTIPLTQLYLQATGTNFSTLDAEVKSPHMKTLQSTKRERSTVTTLQTQALTRKCFTSTQHYKSAT